MKYNKFATIAIVDWATIKATTKKYETNGLSLLSKVGFTFASLVCIVKYTNDAKIMSSYI